MKESLYRRYAVLIGCFLFSLYLIAPTFWRSVPDDQKPKIFLSDGLNLGLDLQGGIHLTMQVMVDEAIQKAAASRATDMATRLKTAGVPLKQDPTVTLEGGVTQTTLQFSSAAERDRGRRILEEQLGDVVLDQAGEDGLLVRGSLQASQSLRDGAVERAIEIFRKRVDALGTTEPVLVREGTDRIVMQLPGLKDPQKAIDLIKSTAQLEFRIVHDGNANLGSILAQARSTGKLGDDPTKEEYQAAVAGQIPPDSELMFLRPVRSTPVAKGTNEAALDEPLQPILLRKKVELTGDAVVDAGTSRDPQTNEPNVQVSLSPAAARTFGELTAANVNHQLAIVLDGEVKSAPNIQEPIPGGQVRISGQFTDSEAAGLALVLRSGALPAKINVIQNITVGASLGQDSIEAGLSAGILGFLFVVFFMVFYYRTSGWIANGALVLNNFMLLGSLAALNATLTLPGIAGIVLSMGMAVDSNVLVFERMRDELDMGRSPSNAIRSGFDKAFWTIFDSHVTTLLTGIVLFMFGTGPIKGFAVTLCIGVSLNLFTALFGARVVYDHLLMNDTVKRIQFRQILRRPNIDFVALRRPAFVLSAVSVVVAAFAMFQISQGKANLGIDFAGGTMVTVNSSKPMQAADARTVLAEIGFADAEVQTAENQGRMLVRLHKAEGTPGELTGKMVEGFQKAHPDMTFSVEGAEVISAAVSKDLRDASVVAVLLSLFGIIGYLSLRFDFRFGVTAAVATFHDVFFVLAVFYMTGLQVNLLFVTALLTVAGYSLTDTVVIFDRLRETRQRFPDMDIKNAINTAVNDVISRTIITSMTVFLVLVALLLFGGPVLFDFSLALLMGVLVGTYSSIFVATPLLYEWESRYGRLQEDTDTPRTFHDSTADTTAPTSA